MSARHKPCIISTFTKREDSKSYKYRWLVMLQRKFKSQSTNLAVYLSLLTQVMRTQILNHEFLQIPKELLQNKNTINFKIKREKIKKF